MNGVEPPAHARELAWPPRAFSPVKGDHVWVAAVGRESLRLRAARVSGRSDDNAWFSLDYTTAPGESGSPVFNQRGELIGIAVASMDSFGSWSVEVNPDREKLFHFTYRYSGRKPPNDLKSTLVVDLTRIDWDRLPE